jgi:hypothetical protein
VRVQAEAREGQFRHRALADEHRTGGVEARCHRGVDGGRRGAEERRRTGARDVARRVEQVLDRDRGAVERAEQLASAPASGRRLRLVARPLGGHQPQHVARL